MKDVSRLKYSGQKKQSRASVVWGGQQGDLHPQEIINLVMRRDPGF